MGGSVRWSSGVVRSSIRSSSIMRNRSSSINSSCSSSNSRIVIVIRYAVVSR